LISRLSSAVLSHIALWGQIQQSGVSKAMTYRPQTPEQAVVRQNLGPLGMSYNFLLFFDVCAFFPFADARGYDAIGAPTSAPFPSHGAAGLSLLHMVRRDLSQLLDVLRGRGREANDPRDIFSDHRD